MSEQRKIPIARPRTGQEEWEACREGLMSGWVAQGPAVEAFERAFADKHGAAHGVAVSSGTAALHLALAALGTGPGDEVLVPSFTWIASANAVCFCGATPVLVDILPATFNIDPADAAKKITGRTRAMVAVHQFGLCADMDELAAIAGDLVIVEDAACAAGAGYKGRTAGSFGRAAAFSFHPRKSITTGEGGMVITDDQSAANAVRSLRNHGATAPAGGPRPCLMPDFDRLGYNYRMTDIQASIGRVQLAKLDDMLRERRDIAARYGEGLKGPDWLSLPAVPEGREHTWQSYVCTIDEEKSPLARDSIMDALQEKGISTRPGTHAVHMLGYYRDRFGYSPGDLPASRDAALRTMAIPLYNGMAGEDVEYVIEAIKSIQ